MPSAPRAAGRPELRAGPVAVPGARGSVRDRFVQGLRRWRIPPLAGEGDHADHQGPARHGKRQDVPCLDALAGIGDPRAIHSDMA